MGVFLMVRGAGACRRYVGLVALLAVSVGLTALPTAAQQCFDCPVYAYVELNLRQEPSLDAAVLRFIPAGADVERTVGEERNGYAPVVYDGVPGWAVAPGLVASPDDVAAVEDLAPGAVSTTDPAAKRTTLVPLMLRSEPDATSEAILVMPEGAVITVTGEGAEDGYVPVAYDGTRGWAYADFLREMDSAP